MSLRLLLDEDSQSQLLVKLLTAADHDVLTINEIGLAGCTDNVVLSYFSGYPTGADNESIDADLGREYGDTHEETSNR
ncbi:MAG: hypothetical protein DWQ53_22875 [Microcystis flos-aquae DF17]|nr:MAG: hypothetical protein DWQ53_22875 [Microcystis flos-aquae DF17]